MEFVVFDNSEADEDGDTIFKTRIKNNSPENPKIYKVTITIDELNDNLYKTSTCGCEGYQKFKKTSCKHRKMFLDLLEKEGWKIRYNEPITKEGGKTK